MQYRISMMISFSVVKTSLHYEALSMDDSLLSSNPVDEVKQFSEEEVGNVEDKIDLFYNSIKSRMMVGEVITNIENNAHFTFDFLMLLILAAIIAFIGLVESSSVVLVASMLISPLMGPILAGIFGSVVGDSKLRHLGVVNEFISLFICIFAGRKHQERKGSKFGICPGYVRDGIIPNFYIPSLNLGPKYYI